MKITGRKQRKELATAIDRSRKLLLAGRHQENFEFLKTAVQRFPDDPEIRLLYATTLLEYRPDDVAAEAAKAVELGPDNPRILVRAAQLMFDRGDVESARSCALRANELAQPGFVLMSGLTNLNGLLAAADGEHDFAEERLRSAVESEPDNGPYAIDLARYLASRGRKGEALEVIDQALMQTSSRDNLERVRAEIAEDGETRC
jgi:Flp pilus assembly protein TadD